MARRLHIRLLATLVILLSGLGSSRAAVAAAPAPLAAPDIDVLARVNRRTASQTRQILSDATAKVGAGDRIQFDEPVPDKTIRQRAAQQTASRTAVDPARTFLLHSRPGSTRVIYLDFDGHSISGTAWNNGTASTIVAPAFSIDESSEFSALEHDTIQSVWQRVAEDFSPFDVDVTTQDPGEAAITRSGLDDLRFGTRALVTNRNVTAPCGCAGRAFLGVFDEPANHAYYQPALIFGHELGGYPKLMADAVSHEVGHNLNLAHDGNATSSYYSGHGPWTPIMGSGWNPVSQWSKGEYAGASNTEDDLQLMQESGLSIFPDDHGDTATAATSLGNGPSSEVAGLISTDADIDVFRVTAPAGMATFTVAPVPTSPNLDLRLELRSTEGNLLASSDPPVALVDFDRASGLDASITVPVTTAGDYFLHVSGVGTGNPSTGYSGYGSLGIYVLKTSTRLPAVSVVSSRNPSTIRQSVTFTASMSVPPPGSGTPTGTVTFNDGESALCRDVPLGGAQASCTATLGAGSRPITALYNGDAAFSSVRSPVLAQEVDGDPVTVTLTSTPNPTDVGGVVTLRSTVSTTGTGATPTGTVTFREGDTVHCVGYALTDGATTCLLRLWRGDHALTATYNGSDQFNRTTSPVHAHVTNGIATTLEASSMSNPSVSNEAVGLQAMVRAASPFVGWSVGGTVTFRKGTTLLCTGTVYSEGVDVGRAACRSSFAMGEHVITAEYSGDNERLPSTSATLRQTVNQAEATVDLTSSSNPSSASQTVWIRARPRAKPPAGSYPTGTVTFTSNGAALCPATPISSGEAVCVRSFPKGTYAITATYGGDTAFKAASSELTQTVGPPAVNVSLASSSNPVARATPLTLTATVRAAVSGLPAGTVTFFDGDTILCNAVPISSSVARCTTSFGAGSRPLRAVYSGDTTFAPGTSPVLQQVVNGDSAAVSVTPIPPSVSGERITLLATVAPSGADLPSPTGSVSFKDGATPLCAGVPLAGGGAACSVALRAGNHSISVGYSGDDRFNSASSATLSHAVTRAGATVAVGASANPNPQQPPTLTATVSVAAPGGAAPTGTVTFKEGATVYCANVAVAEGAASCNPSLTAGTHWITATYSGDSEVEGAASAVHEQFVQPSGDGLTAVTPKRLLDTRTGLGAAAGPMGPGGSRTLQVRGGTTGVPATATTVVLNVTVTSPSALSFLTVHPSATPRPGTSNLTFSPGQTVANLVTVAIGTDDAVAFFNAYGGVHAIADVVGYYSRPGGSTSRSMPAKRLLDTRVGTGGPAGPVGAGATRELTVRGGASSIPETATAVLVNMTVTVPTAAGYLTVHPAGVARPTASNLNFVAGQTVANLTLVGIGSGGRISIFNASGAAHVLVDIVGYYVPAGGSSFKAVPPQRLLDTREQPAGAIGPSAVRDLRVYDLVALPPTAVVLLNVTAVTPTTSGFLTVNPPAGGLPTTSNLNFSPGQVVSNLVVADVNFWDRKVGIYNSDGYTHVVVDIVGYTVPY